MAKRGREGNSELPPCWLAFVRGRCSGYETVTNFVLFFSFRFVSAFDGRLIFLSVLLFIVLVLALFCFLCSNNK